MLPYMLVLLYGISGWVDRRRLILGGKDYHIISLGSICVPQGYISYKPLEPRQREPRQANKAYRDVALAPLASTLTAYMTILG